MKSLKDKSVYMFDVHANDMYPDKQFDDTDMVERHMYFDNDVEAAVKEFNSFQMCYAPYKPICDGCGLGHTTIFSREKFKKDDYQYCRECLVKRIFGDYKKDE